MRSEFYPHFRDVLNALIGKLDAWRTDAELLEKLFERLSYIFKFLQKQLATDLKDIFK